MTIGTSTQVPKNSKNSNILHSICLAPVVIIIHRYLIESYINAFPDDFIHSENQSKKKLIRHNVHHKIMLHIMSDVTSIAHIYLIKM